MSDTSTQGSPQDSTPAPSIPFDFDQFFAEAEQKIADLKARRQSVTLGKTRYHTLRDLKVEPDTLKDIRSAEEIETDLEKIEYELANELIQIVGEENLTWKEAGEGFWTFFRYTGIGFAIAVILHRVIS
jgi:hypothetical protein